jgi:hypothetical protein
MGGVARRAFGGASLRINHFRMQLWQEPHLCDVTFVLPTVLAAWDKVASNVELLLLREYTNHLIKQSIFSLLEGFLLKFIQLLYISTESPVL